MYKFIDLIMTFSVGSAVEKTTNKNVQFGKKRFVSLVKKTKPLQLLRKCEILREVRDSHREQTWRDTSRWHLVAREPMRIGTGQSKHSACCL